MLFKAIESGKEHRKSYANKGSRRSGLYCLCDFSHSSKTWQDPWFRDNRLFANRKREVSAYYDMRDSVGFSKSSFRIK